MVLWPLLILFGGFISLVAILLIGLSLLDTAAYRRRCEAVAAAAEELNLQFSAAEPPDNFSHFPPLPLFERGRNRSAYDFAGGVVGDTDVCLFDYDYQTGGGHGGASTHRRTVVWLRVPELNLPAFSLHPADAVLRFLHRFGTRRDIDFDEFPEFSRRYELTAQQENAVRDLFASQAIDILMQLPARYVVEAAADDVIVYHRDDDPGVYWDGIEDWFHWTRPQALQGFLTDAMRILDCFRRE